MDITSDTTSNNTPSKAKWVSNESEQGQVSPTLSKEVGGGLAKEGGGGKNPQVNMRILELSVEAQKNTPGIGVLDLATMFRDFVFS